MLESFSDWFEAIRVAQPWRARSLLVTVLGDSVAAHGGAIWLATLIDLLAPFGISERGTRTAVFRLVAEDWLRSRKAGRRSRYELTTTGLRRIEHAERRIYGAPRSHWDGNWTFLIIAQSAFAANAAAQLRHELLWEGFAALTPGLLGHPSAAPAALDEILDAFAARDHVSVFKAYGTTALPARALRELVGAAWPLSELAGRYRQFLEDFAPLTAYVERLTPREAFAARTLLIHAYRRAVLVDPQLPAGLLPDKWPGHAAYALCVNLYRALRVRAEEHYAATFNTHAAHTPELSHPFDERFTSAL